MVALLRDRQSRCLDLVGVLLLFQNSHNHTCSQPGYPQHGSNWNLAVDPDSGAVVVTAASDRLLLLLAQPNGLLRTPGMVYAVAQHEQDQSDTAILPGPARLLGACFLCAHTYVKASAAPPHLPTALMHPSSSSSDNESPQYLTVLHETQQMKLMLELLWCDGTRLHVIEQQWAGLGDAFTMRSRHLHMILPVPGRCLVLQRHAATQRIARIAQDALVRWWLYLTISWCTAGGISTVPCPRQSSLVRVWCACMCVQSMGHPYRLDSQ